MKKIYGILLIASILMLAAPISFAQSQDGTNRIDVLVGGEIAISSLPNVGLSPVIKAQWRNYMLSYSFAIMTQQEGWLNFELGMGGKKFSYLLFHKTFVAQFYAELYSSVMARDIRNHSFLSLALGIVGGLRTPLTKKISCDLKLGIGLGTDLKARLWGKVGINILFRSFGEG